MFHLSKHFTLPNDYVTWKAASIGRTGSGKTNFGVMMAEQMIEQGFPFVIIDVQGDWWGLRSKYKMAILGGEHGDIPLEVHAGAAAADFVISERVPVLLDLFSMGESEMVQFGADFAKRLWHRNREALHVFLDEADLFAPQQNAKGQKAVCLGAWQNIVRRGRSRGIGCTMLTQRTAVLNKDLLTQADPLFVFRLTAPQDLASVRDYLEAHGVESKDIKTILADVSKLPVGACWAISPGSLGIEPKRIQVNYRKSFDSSATPEAGQSAATPREFATVDLKALTEQFAATVAKAKEDDPKLLRERIAELQRKLDNQEPVVDDSNTQALVDQAVADRDAHWSTELDRLRGILQAMGDGVARAKQHLQAAGESLGVPPPIDEPAAPPPPVPRAPAPVHHQATAAPRPAVKSSNGLPKAERSILIALAQYPQGRTRVQVAVLTGYSNSGGGFRNALGALRTAGHMVGSDDQLRITPQGKAILGSFERLPVGRALCEHWKSQLPKAEREILTVLVAAYPKGLTKEQIAERSESKYESTGGGFRNAIGKLRTLELIVGKDMIAASKDLFG